MKIKIPLEVVSRLYELLALALRFCGKILNAVIYDACPVFSKTIIPKKF